jgi:hypothetical protein
MKRFLYIASISAVLLAACEKEITVDLPDAEEQLVVEGTVEPGRAPFVILTRTQSFFAPTDVNSLASIFVSGAIITVDDGDGPVALDQICSDDLTEEEIATVAEITGLDPELLTAANICAYSKLDGSLDGEIGRDYALTVQAEGKTLTSTTHLYEPVGLDTVWFKLAEQNPGDDSLGYIWQTSSEPAGLGNYYRWMGRRISHDLDGEIKDPYFISPFFASFEDKYIDGLTFDWSINRGSVPYSTDEDDLNEEAGYFKRNDTVVVKFVSFGRAEYEFYRSLDNNVTSQGDIFSNPANVESNIEGGLGIWAGWSPWLDTLVCIP